MRYFGLLINDLKPTLPFIFNQTQHHKHMQKSFCNGALCWYFDLVHCFDLPCIYIQDFFLLACQKLPATCQRLLWLNKAVAEHESTDLSTLRAHRFRTVMPTEAFCRKGTSLHRQRPTMLSSRGQRDARSWWKKKKRPDTQKLRRIQFYCIAKNVENVSHAIIYH